ncbi:nucleotidyltransferase [Halobacillus seohaensis]|uniref:Cyclic GMP-AMP synthase n=1 Tax=Halobacillus seohaensis TaxID=447421 RepID=A0ABW2EII7_9BACI
MFDLNSKFKTFYEDHIRLSEDEIRSLREKKKLNVDRLKEGLKEYNEENDTSYSVVEDHEQGSVAMRSVIQHEENEYDIDVAVVFDKDSIPEGTRKVKAIIEDALKRKVPTKASPKAKTNAITVEYASGYHIDFAVYRRDWNIFQTEYEYEHCGSEWRERHPKAINEWFQRENDQSTNNIRKVVRLLKAYCKKNSGWLMPGGLMLSILTAEQIQNYERLDRTFYETAKAIKQRLEIHQDIRTPPNFRQSIIYKEKDKQKVKNLYSRLKKALEKLEVLFDANCDEDKATDAWAEFFEHSFWNGNIQKGFSEAADTLRDTKPALLDVETMVYVHREKPVALSEFPGKLPKDCRLEFRAFPRSPYSHIKWIINNYGDEAGEDRNRHTLLNKFITTHKRQEEYTKYRGSHTMTCQIHEGSRVVAQRVIRINVQ